jgi:hypothetical protein
MALDERGMIVVVGGLCQNIFLYDDDGDDDYYAFFIVV